MWHTSRSEGICLVLFAWYLLRLYTINYYPLVRVSIVVCGSCSSSLRKRTNILYFAMLSLCNYVCLIMTLMTANLTVKDAYSERNDDSRLQSVVPATL